MSRLRLAIVGWGRLGRACGEALHGDAELTLAGIVRGAATLESTRAASPLPGVPCVSHLRELGSVDAALLCVPSDAAVGVAQELLQMRVPIVECASFEAKALRDYHASIAHFAERHRVSAVVGAGWDPGVLPQLQRLFEVLIPRGRTRVGRHVAAGLHHTAVAEGVAGVQGALSSEVPDPAGGTRRYVYVQLARGADFERVRAQIEADPLYADEPTQVLPVPDVAAMEQQAQGVLVERLDEGAAGPHGSLLLEARLDPAGFCARLMLDAARVLPRYPHGGWRYTPVGLVPLAEAAERPMRRDRTTTTSRQGRHP
jgi:diaminopimelate dehydrogenase